LEKPIFDDEILLEKPKKEMIVCLNEKLKQYLMIIIKI
jgi:hypothetical protein